MLFAVAATEAIPLALVTAVGAESEAPAPLAGAEKLTVTPLTGFPPASVRIACSAAGNAVPACVYCGVPPDAVRLAGKPAMFARANAALSDPEVAVTV